MCGDEKTYLVTEHSTIQPKEQSPPYSLSFRSLLPGPNLGGHQMFS
jgi:hypothetical protein